MWQALAKLDRLVLLVLLRLTVGGEHATEASLSPPSAYGQFLYEHWVFDVPRILDAAAVYGGRGGAGEAVHAALREVYRLEPRYYGDTSDCAVAIAGVRGVGVWGCGGCGVWAAGCPVTREWCGRPPWRPRVCARRSNCGTWCPTATSAGWRRRRTQAPSSPRGRRVWRTRRT